MHIFTKTLANSLLVAVACFSMAPAVQAKPTLSDWEFGQVVAGEMPSKADLKNKVVVVEYWGVNCSPCIASLPHLAEMYKKHSDDGLVIIGAESQGSNADVIKKVIEKAKVTYPIVQGANGPIAVSGIPRAFVFNPDGELVWDGNPLGSQFDDAVKDCLKLVKSANQAKTGPAVTAPLLFSTRSWTNSDGKAIRAAIKRVTDTNVTFVMPNLSEVQYPLAKLSQESREMIAEVAGTAKSTAKNESENAE